MTLSQFTKEKHIKTFHSITCTTLHATRPVTIYLNAIKMTEVVCIKPCASTIHNIIENKARVAF